jgi:hypothetical protein
VALAAQTPELQSLDSYLAQAADPGVETISIPRGRYAMSFTKKFNVTRSNLLIDGNGSTFVYDTADSKSAEPFNFTSPIALTSRRPQGEFSFTADITPILDRITLSEPCPNVAAGDIVKLRLGVSAHDPREPETQLFIPVKAVEGLTVIFARPINRRVTQWTDESLKAATQYDDRVGPRANGGGAWFRGYGQDHGMTTYVKKGPLTNIKIRNIVLEFDPAKPAPYASRCFEFENCDGVEGENITVINPVSTVWRIFASENVTLRGLKVLGEGRKDIWQDPNNLFPASVLSFWGGTNCRAYNVHLDGADLVLLSGEVGSVGTLVDGAYVRTWKKLGAENNRIQLGMHGVHPGCKVDNIRFDIPAAPSALTASTVGNGLQIGDMAFENGELPASLSLARFNITGSIRIGRQVFKPMTRRTKEFVLPAMAIHKRYVLPIDPGLYRSMRIKFDRRDGVNSVRLLPAFVTNPTQLDFTFDPTYFGTALAGPFISPWYRELDLGSAGPAFEGTKITLEYELMPL